MFKFAMCFWIDKILMILKFVENFEQKIFLQNLIFQNKFTVLNTTWHL